MIRNHQPQSLAETKRYQELQFHATKANVRRLLRHYAIEPEDISVPKNGVENTTLIITTAGNRYALRVYRQKKKTTTAIKQEVAFTHYLADNGIPVPQIIANTNGEDVTEVVIDGTLWQCLLMSFVDGKHPSTYNDPLISQMAQMQARIHLLSERYRQTPTAAVNFMTPLAIYSVMTDFILPKGLCHLDFTIGNILVAHDRITAVLDFDDMREVPIIDCLAISIKRLISDTDSYRFMALYLEAYQKLRHLSAAEKQRLYERIFIRPRVAQAIGKFL